MDALSLFIDEPIGLLEQNQALAERARAWIAQPGNPLAPNSPRTPLWKAPNLVFDASTFAEKLIAERVISALALEERPGFQAHIRSCAKRSLGKNKADFSLAQFLDCAQSSCLTRFFFDEAQTLERFREFCSQNPLLRARLIQTGLRAGRLPPPQTVFFDQTEDFEKSNAVFCHPAQIILRRLPGVDPLAQSALIDPDLLSRLRDLLALGQASFPDKALSKSLFDACAKTLQEAKSRERGQPEDISVIARAAGLCAARAICLGADPEPLSHIGVFISKNETWTMPGASKNNPAIDAFISALEEELIHEGLAPSQALSGARLRV